MILIGEKLNSSIPSTLEAMLCDDTAVQQLITDQAGYGADYLDVNTALLDDGECSEMLRICSFIRSTSDCGIMLDSPNPQVLIDCLSKVDGDVIINSVLPGDSRYFSLIAAAAERGAGIVCLPMIAGRIPKSAEERLSAARGMTDILVSAGCKPQNIYIDILVQPVSTDTSAAVAALETLRLVSTELPGVRTVCGLSNVSYGLPLRAKLNSTFLAMALYLGLDAAILDVTSQSIRDVIFPAAALLGKDEYCMDFLAHTRQSVK